MATTKIWGIKGRVQTVLRYTANPVKTWNENFSAAAKFHRTDESKDGTVEAVMQYTADEMKTERQYYVSGVNCDSDTDVAARQFHDTYARRKHDGFVCFHAYQSFQTGEVTPEEAHNIGIELARRMWGDQFEVLVSTHLNTRTVHNHFCINAISFVDGSRYYDNRESYAKLRQISDEICVEHGLSVIDHPKNRNATSIAEIHAEAEGRYTVRGQIRRDIDLAISHNTTWRYFVREFESLGYTMEWRGKYLRVRPDSSPKFFRLDKLGEGYTTDDLYERLNQNFRHPARTDHQRFTPTPRPKVQGLHALYLHYCYLLGELPKSHPNNREMYAAMKEDLKKMERYSKEADLLGRNHIETDSDLAAYTERLSAEFRSLAMERGKQRNRLRRMRDSEEMQPIKDRIADLSDRMADLRRKMKLCEDIAERSGMVECIVNGIENPQQNQSQRRENKRE